jgi:hypothetical protein
MVAVAMSNYRPQDSAIENLAHITTILEYKELPNIAKAATLDDTMTPAYSCLPALFAHGWIKHLMFFLHFICNTSFWIGCWISL